VSEAFALDAGLMFVPFSRNSVQSAATLLPKIKSEDAEVQS
jgi:hypothetical protein